jgi:Nif-specific regulatory protein
MTQIVDINRLKHTTIGARMLPRLISAALESGSQAELGELAVREIRAATPMCRMVTLVRGIKGTWRQLVSAGGTSASPAILPIELMSEALDCEECSVSGEWVVVPVDVPNHSGRLLVMQFEDSRALTADDAESLAAAYSLADLVYRGRSEPSQRAERLRAMLDMTARWNQSRKTDQLLVEIAEASTRLLGAERATIFLLDSRGSMLLGKPALGVESGELKIPATAGVVGAVVQSGQPQRVDSDIAAEQQQIHRSVDDQLNFRTRSLLCVPLINSRGHTMGAFELINKIRGNFTDDDQSALIELAAHAAVAVEKTQQVEQLASTNKVVADQAAGKVQLIGTCGQLVQLKKTIARVANTDLAILITGENGTGKEVVAQMVHYMSNRRDQVLVAVNCAAITESLLESELFGHEKGAFTDAVQARAGKFELADKGTLFLDEIGDMSLGGQSKLLRVLEEKTVVRVGGSTPITTSARIIAATNQDLAKLVQEKRFREDLFFRLNVVTIVMPPLRDRGDDILLLAEHFLTEFCGKARRETLQLSPAARKKLLLHPWPGNVRELRNLMERLAYLSAGQIVDPDDLAFVNSPRSGDSPIPLDRSLNQATRQFQCDYIRRHIERSGGNMTDTAARLGLHRSNLYRKMRQLGMSEGEQDDLGDNS